MSSASRITDDEMRYYQFKARQRFLIKKEDHDWNEFCQKNKCSYCSCLPMAAPALQGDVRIQASPNPTSNVRNPATPNSTRNNQIKTAPNPVANTRIKAAPNTNFSQNTKVKRVPEGLQSRSLNDLKVEIAKLKLAVADIQLNCSKERKETIKNTTADNDILESESALNLLNEQRQNLIRACLLNSLQKLHSTAPQKVAKPVSVPGPKNKGFFLHPNLERQRLIARNAYLSSLINKPKIKSKVNVKPLDNKKKKSSENIKKQPQSILSKARRKKVAPTAKLKEEKTLIQTEESTDKDENIESAVDGIVEDLLGEEVLALNRIRYMKLEKQNTNLRKGEDAVIAGPALKDIRLSQPSPETRAKIKQIPFFDFIKRNPEGSSLLKNSSQSNPAGSGNQIESTVCPRTVNSKNLFDKHVNLQTSSTNEKEAQTDIIEPILPKTFRTLCTDPNLAIEVSKQRKRYFQYLERVSRHRSHNFDPIAVSNMVAESLLNDCISDICEELEDVPTSLIADLYKQEFTPSL